MNIYFADDTKIGGDSKYLRGETQEEHGWLEHAPKARR